MLKELKEFGIEYQENVILKEYTTLHIGGKADYIVFPKSINEIQKCIELFRQYHIDYTVLGAGSNILVLDEGYQGGIIFLKDNFSKIKKKEKTYVQVQSGALLKDLCQFCLEQELTGLEFACGIPGSVGGAVYMNAGAYGGEMKDVVDSVTFLDEHNCIQKLTRNELCFDYRQSYFNHHKSLILEVVYCLAQGDSLTIQQRMSELMKKRYLRQPMDAYSAGSTFKRPNGHYASALIKQCELQGLRVGDAEVSQKHAVFLINRGKATSQDFLSLMQKVQKTVYKETGYILESEVQILGNKKRTSKGLW